MRVYRVCHRENIGEGMYCQYSPLKQFQGEKEDPYYGPNHPTPNDDFEEFYRFDYVHHYGFASMQQAREWLHEDAWVFALKAGQFILASFDVNPIYVFTGKKQIAFDIRRAKHIRNHSLEELL